jgi:hypothetical protein
METESSSEALVTILSTTRRQNPESRSINFHRHEMSAFSETIFVLQMNICH